MTKAPEDWKFASVLGLTEQWRSDELEEVLESFCSLAFRYVHLSQALKPRVLRQTRHAKLQKALQDFLQAITPPLLECAAERDFLLRPSETANSNGTKRSRDRSGQMELKDASQFADQQSADFTDRSLPPLASSNGMYRKKTLSVSDSRSDSQPEVPLSPSATERLQNFGPIRFARGAAKNVRQFVEFPFNENSDKQAADTLAALEPFFWLLRALGLCSLVSIFATTGTAFGFSDKVRRRWNAALTVYCGTVGLFLVMGFFSTFGFALMWPLAFCAGFQTMMKDNHTYPYCKTDVMVRFLTPTGMSTIVQSAFLFIGVSNGAVSVMACRRLGPMIKLLREYYATTRAQIVQSHRKMAIIHAVLAVVVALSIGIPFTLVYEYMLDEMKTEKAYEGYPFAAIDSPLVKIENWIAYSNHNYTISKNRKNVLYGVKIAFRAENFFMFLSCFAVPFFFSLMCDVHREGVEAVCGVPERGLYPASLSVETLRNIRTSHWILCKIFYFLDGCFSTMILIIYVLFVVVNSSIIYIVLKFGTVAQGKDRFAFYQALLMFVALEIIFFLSIRQAMRVHAIADEVIVAVRDWQPEMTDDKFAAEYLLLLNQVSSSAVSFTAGNCFRIEGTAYINALAIIFSYVLMLLQFQPPSESSATTPSPATPVPRVF
ncbi:hypothetical protein BV898_05833 [Hypsibius exemplaris]|uniref:Gustatory receptor n=1 Tax=Hypsibius exemplaris TaxID=2072580 RepID=A0A1W0WYS1_HYPEX|nr:hypothetical protein BV898_05833 [Hypsibius exemplaris]